MKKKNQLLSKQQDGSDTMTILHGIMDDSGSYKTLQSGLTGGCEEGYLHFSHFMW